MSGEIDLHADLREADLREADLSGAVLAGACLDGCQLSGAVLVGADLREVSLRNASLVNADLSGVNLSGAEIWDSDLSGARMVGADLRGASLIGAVLTGVDLSSADLSRAELPEVNLAGAIMRGIVGRHVDLGDTDLSSADLREACLEEAHLSSANLRGARLESCSLKSAALMGAYMRAADLRSACLDDARLSAAVLSDANLERAQLRNAALAYVRAVGASLRSADLDGAVLRGASLGSADFSGCSMRAADLRKADLSGAILVRTDLRDADLGSGKSVALLRGTDLSYADLNGAKLGADALSVAALRDTKLPDGSICTQVPPNETVDLSKPSRATSPLQRDLPTQRAVGNEYRKQTEKLAARARRRLEKVEYFKSLRPPKALLSALPGLLERLEDPKGALADEHYLLGVPPFIYSPGNPTCRDNQLSSDDLRQLDELWDPEIDQMILSYVSTYSSRWFDCFQQDWWRRLELWRDDLTWTKTEKRIRFQGASSSLSNTLGMYVEDAAILRSLQLTTWTWPNLQRCDVCGVLHAYESFRNPDWAVRQWAGPGICATCAYRARGFSPEFGVPAHRSDVETTLDALRQFHRVTGLVPTQRFRSTTAAGMSRSERARLAAALICVPNTEDLCQRMKAKSWIEVLRASEIAPDGWRPSFGTFCVASDGHMCRSLGELAIDNYMSVNRIWHEVEPLYPQHHEFNPYGRKRADWLLEDGRYVEYAGLEGSSTYDKKMREKVQLARQTGVDLLVIRPSDLTRLSSLLGAQPVDADK